MSSSHLKPTSQRSKLSCNSDKDHSYSCNSSDNNSNTYSNDSDKDHRNGRISSSSCSRRHITALQNEKEQKEELVQRWCQDQQEWRLKVVQRELLQQVGEASNQQQQNQQPSPGNSIRSLVLFILLFLAIIPLMSTNTDSNPWSFSKQIDSSSGMTRGKSNLSDPLTSATNLNNKSSASSSGGTDTLVISVSHVDYYSVPSPKKLQLQFQEHWIPRTLKGDANSFVSCNASILHAEKEQGFQIIETHPYWTLQQQSQQYSSSPSSFTVVAIVRHVAHELNNHTEHSILTEIPTRKSVVAVAMLQENKSTKVTTSSRNHPLEFIRVEDMHWIHNEHEQNNLPPVNSSLTVTYHIQLLSYHSCEAFAHIIDSPTAQLPLFAVSLYSTVLDSMPSFREIPIPSFPISRDNNDTIAMFFGWDKIYEDFQRLIPDDKEEIVQSQINYSGLQSLGSLLRPQNVAKMNRNTGKSTQDHVGPLTLTMDHLSSFLQQLERLHGELLLYSNFTGSSYQNANSFVLVIGSSVHDALAFFEQRSKSGRTHSNTSWSSAADSFESELESIENSTVGENSAQDLPETSDHLFACRELILRLENLYPNVELVWQLPLYVPGISRDFWQAETKYFNNLEKKIPTWDLYSISFLAWATDQHQRDAVGMENSSLIDYSPAVYEWIAHSVLSTLK